MHHTQSMSRKNKKVKDKKEEEGKGQDFCMCMFMCMYNINKLWQLCFLSDSAVKYSHISELAYHSPL